VRELFKDVPSAGIHKINTFKIKTINKLIIRHHHNMPPTQRKHSAGEKYHWITHRLGEELAENYQPMSQNNK
jgi:hypothetical protein